MPAQEALNDGSVVALDADSGVDAEAAGSLPDPPSAGARHALGIGIVEKAAGAEVPEYAALNDTLEVEPVVLVEQGGLVEADSVVGDLRKDAVEDHEMEVEVGVER